MKKISADGLVLLVRCLLIGTILLMLGAVFAMLAIVPFPGLNDAASAIIIVFLLFAGTLFAISAIKKWWTGWAIKKVGILELQKALDRGNLLGPFLDYLKQYRELNEIKPKTFSDFTDDPSVPEQTVVYYRSLPVVFATIFAGFLTWASIRHAIGSPPSVGVYFAPVVLLVATLLGLRHLTDRSKWITLSNEGIKIGPSFYRWSWITGYKTLWHPEARLAFRYNGKMYILSLEHLAVRRSKMDHLLAVYFGRAMKDVKYSTCTVEHEGRKFVIEEQHQTEGAYLLIYESGICSEDHHQDNVQMCKEYALEEFGVPLYSWSCEEK